MDAKQPEAVKPPQDKQQQGEKIFIEDETARQTREATDEDLRQIHEEEEKKVAEQARQYVQRGDNLYGKVR